MNAKAGEPQVLAERALIDAAVAQVEKVRLIQNLARLAIDDFIHVHRLLEAAAHVKELETEVTVLLAPQRLVTTKPNRLIFVVAHFLKHSRRELRGRRERFTRQRARFALQRGVVELACRSSCRGWGGGRSEAGGGEGGEQSGGL